MLSGLKDIKKILIFTGGGIGDVIMSLPTLKSLHECFKDKEIDIAISSRTRDIIDTLPNWNDIIIWDKGLVKKTISRSIISNYKLFLELRRKQYDLLIDIETIESLRAAVKRFVFFKLINVKKIAGRDTDGKGFFLHYGAKERLLSTEHEVNRRLSVVEALGCKISNMNMFLELTDSHIDKANNILQARGLTDSDFIVGINPNAFRPTRRWGIDRFIMLAKKIRDYYGAKLFIIGGEGDASTLEIILRELGTKGCFELIGLDLITLAAVISRLNVLVTNDTGPMHIAAAVKTPVVAIFGPENPHRYAPYISDEFRRLVYINNVSCRPCTKFNCADTKCMNDITVDMVWENFKSLVDDLKLRQEQKKIRAFVKTK